MLGETTQEKKRVIFSVNRPQRDHEVEISPGETFCQIMERLGLRAADYIALRPRDNLEFQPQEAVWPYVGDGEKIHINMRSDVGGLGLFAWLQPRKRVKAIPRMRTYAQDLGWNSIRNADGTIQHQGFYYTRRRGRWLGRALQHGQNLSFQILDPPMDCIRGTGWAGCFHAISPDGWWGVTFKPGTEPKDLDSGLMGIIKILEICLRQRAATR